MKNFSTKAEEEPIIGNFHLGLKYDVNIWTSNRYCGVFTCKEEKEGVLTGRDSQSGKRGHVEIVIVLTDSIFLILEPDSKIKNVARLMAWATLASIEQIRRNTDIPDSVTFVWRKVDERDPWQLTVTIKHSQDCINMLTRHLKNLGINTNKNYEKRRKI